MTHLETPWYNVTQLEELYAQLELGCKLEFKRSCYFHWAIYVGQRADDDYTEVNKNNDDNSGKGEEENEEQTDKGDIKDNEDEKDKSQKVKLKHMVIHRWVPPEIERNDLISDNTTYPREKRFGKIRLTTIEETLGEYEVRINNEMDKYHLPKDPLEIVAIAEKLMNDPKQKPYSVLTGNCEHFANQCRYGIEKSEQITEFGTKVAVTTAIGGASVGARVGIGILAASALVPAVAAPAVIIGGSVLCSIPWVVHGIQHLVKISKRKKNN